MLNFIEKESIRNNKLGVSDNAGDINLVFQSFICLRIIFGLAGSYRCFFRTNVYFSLGAKRLFFILAWCKPFLRVVFSLIYLFEFSNTFGRFHFMQDLLVTHLAKFRYRKKITPKTLINSILGSNVKYMLIFFQLSHYEVVTNYLIINHLVFYTDFNF